MLHISRKGEIFKFRKMFDAKCFWFKFGFSNLAIVPDANIKEEQGPIL